LLLFVCYLIILDNTDISTLNKGKTPASTNSIEIYSKETFGDEIRRLITINVQLIIDKMKTEKTRVNLEADRIRLLGKKNSLVVKRKKLRTEIVALNAAEPFNIPICRYQDLFLRLIQNKFKVKRSPFFNSLKENFQRFFTEIRYYQGFYQQNLLFDSNKIQDIIINKIEDVSK